MALKIISSSSSINANQSADKNKIESYLAIKYGLTLNQSGTTAYISSIGTTIWNTPGYWNNITVISRDDASALNQLQSQSSNVDINGDQVIIGNGTFLATTNATNANPFATNNSFEAIGDNGGANTFTIAYTGANNINFRLPRVWNVQETGTIGTVTVAYPVSAFGTMAKPTLLVVTFGMALLHPPHLAVLFLMVIMPS